MLSSLLSQFRQRYPQGSLTSNLLTIHDGLYVVRVCAGVDGITLASALGANTTLEAAEDIATTRALERLGISVAPPTSLIPPPGLPPIGLQPDSPDARPPAVPVLQPALFKVKVGPTAELPIGVSPEHQSFPNLLPTLPEPANLPLPLAQPEPADTPKAPALNLPPTALASPPLPKAAPLPPDSLLPKEPLADSVDEPDEFMDLGSGPAMSVDLSDIIAQTDVELQRLGWGVNQGREFLEKTYSKRSRHDLTDDELLEFLLFLETQPTPGSP